MSSGSLLGAILHVTPTSPTPGCPGCTGMVDVPTAVVLLLTVAVGLVVFRFARFDDHDE